MEFKVIETYSPLEFKTEVQSALDDGWVIDNSFYTTIVHNNEIVANYVAYLIKYAPDELDDDEMEFPDDDEDE